MTTTPSPCSRRRWISSSTCAVCTTPSAAVGSSRITRRGLPRRERAIATDWRWPPESDPTARADARQRGHRERVEELAVLCSIACSSSEPARQPGSAARRRGTGWRRRRGCRRARGPGRRSRSRACGVGGAADADALAVDRDTSPESAGWTPAIALISVDLPAPLSPTNATTSPASTSKSTSTSASTRPKRLQMPVALSRGCAWGRGSGSAGAEAEPTSSGRMVGLLVVVAMDPFLWDRKSAAHQVSDSTRRRSSVPGRGRHVGFPRRGGPGSE